jgi:hypothetical protein
MPQETVHQLSCFNVETSVINKYYLNLQLHTFKSIDADAANGIESIVTIERKDLFLNKKDELIKLKEKMIDLDNLTYYFKTIKNADSNRLLSNVVTKDSLKKSIILVYQDIILNRIMNCEVSAYITQYTLESYLKSDYSVKIGWIDRVYSEQLQQFYTSPLEQPYNLPLQCQINPFTFLSSSSSSSSNNSSSSSSNNNSNSINSSKPNKKLDHAFAVIIHNSTGKITHVVDLWQIFIHPHYEPFIGTIDEYINFLKLEGVLKVEKIMKEDIVFAAAASKNKK